MFRRLVADTRAAAAAEMALVIPLLLLLMCGCFEAGSLFFSEHVVQKGVRDAARYASRLPITDYPSCEPTGDAKLRIQRIARTGAPDGTAQLVRGWTADTMTAVELDCLTIGSPYQGLYEVYPFPDGIPVVTVSASVPYLPFFSQIGLGSTSFTLTAESQAAVFAQ